MENCGKLGEKIVENSEELDWLCIKEKWIRVP